MVDFSLNKSYQTTKRGRIYRICLKLQSPKKGKSSIEVLENIMRFEIRILESAVQLMVDYQILRHIRKIDYIDKNLENKAKFFMFNSE